MTDELDNDYVEIPKSELDELKSKIEEQEIIIAHTKEYAFGVESKNIKYLRRIKELKDEIELYESSTSWKLTKPLRWIMSLFK